MATDNYIEKYLPFALQNLISKNVLNMLPQQVRQLDEHGREIQIDYTGLSETE